MKQDKVTRKNNLLILSILLILTILSSLVPVSLFAQTGVVNGTNVNVREGTNTTYPLLFQLNKGEQVTIKEEKNGWYLVDAKKGSGWVAAWLVGNTGNAQASRNAIITGSIVNVRLEPSTDSSRVTQVKAKDVVQIIGQKADWYQVKTSSGKEGWIANGLLSIENSIGPATSPSIPVVTPPTPSTPVQNKTVIVTGSVVNIRDSDCFFIEGGGKLSNTLLVKKLYNTKRSISLTLFIFQFLT